jgi:hypothetical protein
MRIIFYELSSDRSFLDLSGRRCRKTWQDKEFSVFAVGKSFAAQE